MVMKLNQLPDIVNLLPLYHIFVDDFDEYVSADRWTLVATDSGTATVGDAADGIISLAASDGTAADNDESYLKGTHETWLIADEKPIDFRAVVLWTEANTDDANVMIGLMNGVAANSLQDNGAGPKADFSGAVFYKIDGGTNWNVMYSDGTTQTSAELTAANSLTGAAIPATTAVDHDLAIQIRPTSSAKVDIIFLVDGKPVYKMTDKTYANAEEMQLCLAVKNGGANAEVLTCDFVTCVQARTET